MTNAVLFSACAAGGSAVSLLQGERAFADIVGAGAANDTIGNRDGPCVRRERAVETKLGAARAGHRQFKLAAQHPGVVGDRRWHGHRAELRQGYAARAPEPLTEKKPRLLSAELCASVVEKL